MLIAVGLVFFGFAASAQVSKGTVTVGGNVGFGTSKTKDADDKSTTFSIQPQVGYFLSDKLEGYIKLGYVNDSNQEMQGTVLGKKNTDQFGGGVGLRRYFMVSDNVAIFAGPELSYYSGSTKFEPKGGSSEKLYNTNTFNANINAGVGVFFTKNIGLVAGLGVLSFESETHKPNGGGDKSTNTSFNLLANNAPFALGIVFHF
ncbi:hypothetical protein D3C80_380170 [compost metagenome]